MPGVFRIRWPERGTPERIERGGVEARESADGKLIYLLGHEQDSLLRVRPVDGDEWRLVDAMPKVEPGHWGCIREGIYFCRVSPSHLTQTGFLPYGSRQLRALPECPANAIGTEHLTGFALDWSGQRVYWCHGHTPTSVCLGRGFRT